MMSNSEKKNEAFQITFRSIISIFPLLGQFGEGRQSFIRHSASEGMLLNCLILSTDTILFSMKQLIDMVQNNAELRESPYERDSPTNSAAASSNYLMQ
jgi:hypothetical protein